MFNKASIEQYFTAEKQESLLFLCIGIAGIVLAVVFFFFIKTPFYKGMAIPLALIGLLLGIVGYTVYNRSDADRIRNVYALDMHPQELKTKELPRMETVMKSFVLYRYVEIVLAVVGISLLFYYRENPGQAFWKGLGIGLAIMSLMALGADYFAEKRGHTYINGLRSLIATLK